LAALETAVQVMGKQRCVVHGTIRLKDRCVDSACIRSLH
jgi:hypothetical protein